MVCKAYNPAFAQNLVDGILDPALSGRCGSRRPARAVFRPGRSASNPWATPFNSVTFLSASVVMTASPMLLRVVCSQSRDSLVCASLSLRDWIRRSRRSVPFWMVTVATKSGNSKAALPSELISPNLFALLCASSENLVSCSLAELISAPMARI